MARAFQAYLISDLSGEPTAVLTTVWWWQLLGRDWQPVNKQIEKFDMKRFKLKKLNEVESNIGLTYQIGRSL
jgi:hypothetical protein